MEWLQDKGMWIAIIMLTAFSILLIVTKSWHPLTFPIWLGDAIMLGYIGKKLFKYYKTKRHE